MKNILIWSVALILSAGCSSEPTILNTDVETPESTAYYIEIANDIATDYNSGSHEIDVNISTNIDPDALLVYTVCSTSDNSWIECNLDSYIENEDLTYSATFKLYIEAQDEFSFSARNAAIQIYCSDGDILTGDSLSIMQSGSDSVADIAIITGATNKGVDTLITTLQDDGSLDADLTIYTKVFVSGNTMDKSDLTAIQERFTNATYLDISNTTTTTIPASQYKDDSILEQIILPTTLLSINNNAFSNSALTAITIPSSVTTWSQTAFANCKSLESVSLSDGFTSLSGYLFEGCDSLESLTCYCLTPPTIDHNPICAIGYEDVTIYVPEESINDYEQALGWSDCPIMAIEY